MITFWFTGWSGTDIEMAIGQSRNDGVSHFTKTRRRILFCFFFHPSFIFQEKKKQNKAKQKKEKFGYRVVLRHLRSLGKKKQNKAKQKKEKFGYRVVLRHLRSLGIFTELQCIIQTRECPV